MRKKRQIFKIPSVEIKQPKIVLDRSFVRNYLRAQEESSNAIEKPVSATNISIISLDSSSDGHDDSVIFVSEEKKDESPNTKIAVLSKAKETHSKS